MSVMNPLDRVLDRLANVRPTGDGHTANCPCHDDCGYRLSVSEADDGRVLLHCFAGCPPERIVAALGLDWPDLFTARDDNVATARPVPSAAVPAAPGPVPGCSLEDYSATKRLPAPFLRSVGVREERWRNPDRTVIRFPYPDDDGNRVQVRYRLVLYIEPSDKTERFKWKKGSVPDLYGRDRRAQAVVLGYVTLVEGESDAQTLWFHNESAIGLPGADTWNEARDAPWFDGIPTIFVVLEPDSGGVAVARTLLRSRIKDRMRVVRLGEFKDVSGLYLADPDRFPQRWAAAKEAATPLVEVGPALEADAASATDAAPDPAAAPAHPATISAVDLVGLVLPEPCYAVPGIVPDGLSLLVGPPKKGKSFWVLYVGIAVALGGVALGKVPVEGGRVLYLALEDGRRRLQERLVRILEDEPVPALLEFATTWPPLGEGGGEALRAWLVTHPDARLVIIDTFARFRPKVPAGGSLYLTDYADAAAVKAIADEYRVAIVLVHHSRKEAAEDPLDAVSGTAGLAGAADAVLVLRREIGTPDAGLYVRGRDVPEADLAMGFDPVTCRWTLLGNAEQYRLTEGRAAVVELLRATGPLGPKEVAEKLGAERGNTRVLLHRMARAGQLVNLGQKYGLPLVDAPPADPPVTGVTAVTPATDGPVSGAESGDSGSRGVTAGVTAPVTPPEAEAARSVPADAFPVTSVTGVTGGDEPPTYAEEF